MRTGRVWREAEEAGDAEIYVMGGKMDDDEAQFWGSIRSSKLAQE
jgi:hypothetical protein